MKTDDERIILAHGGGGVLMRELVGKITSIVGSSTLADLQDSAVIKTTTSRIAFTADSFVVDPIFFPGGDIGKLAVFGTVNDLAVCGARPVAISLSFIVEEGFEIELFEKILYSVREASKEAEVEVVTGDTKVVERGKADKLFVNTSGIGAIPENVNIGTHNAEPGDVIIINGTIGEHGLAIMSTREGIDFGVDISSDSAPLSKIIVPMIEKGFRIKAMRDATRGGVSAVLNEIASDSNVGLLIREDDIPISEAVIAGCELMGYEPLSIANEGKFVAVVAEEDAEAVLDFMRGHPLGKDSAIIGKVVDEYPGRVVMETMYGGKRVIDVPYGDQLPRIC